MLIRPDSEHFPLSGRTVALLCLGYLLFGLTGHDPWKTDDVINISLAQGFLEGNWLIPTLAGEPWLAGFPLYHWVAAFLGRMLTPLLQWHEAARLASGLFSGLGLYALFLAARGFYGRNAGLLAPLLAIGSLGFLLPSHEAQPALVSFLATAMVLAALGNWKTNRTLAAASLGISIGIGFLGTGLGTLIFLGITALTSTTHPRWHRASGRSWGYAVSLAMLITLFWPTMLYLYQKPGFDSWWATAFTLLSDTPVINVRRFETLGWATWPVLPLGLWTIWLQRNRLLSGQNYMPLAAVFFAFIFFLRSTNLTDGLLPLIAALCLLGSAGADSLRRGAANAFDWFGGITLSLFMGLIWLGGIAILTGQPARVAKNFTIPAPGFIPEWSWAALAVAVVVTLFWLGIIFIMPRSPWRATLRWSFGIITLWILLATLWLPWIEYGKTYRSTSADFRQALGNNPGCIERQGLGPAQRASLDYFDGIRTVPATATKNCPYWLLQTTPRAAKEIDGWNLVLDTARPGDKNESLRLYRQRD
jgi:hypothetical protein